MLFRRSDRPIHRQPLSVQAARLLALTLCVGAAVWISALVRGSFDALEWQLIGTTVAASVFGYTALVGAALIDGSIARRRAGQLTIVLSALDFCSAVVAIWAHLPGQMGIRLLMAVSALLAASVHACAVLKPFPASEDSWAGTLTRFAIGFASGAALLAAGLVFVHGQVPTGPARLDGVLFVLAVLMTLLRPLVRRMARNGKTGAGAPPHSGSGEGPAGDQSMRFSVAPPTDLGRAACR